MAGVLQTGGMAEISRRTAPHLCFREILVPVMIPASTGLSAIQTAQGQTLRQQTGALSWELDRSGSIQVIFSKSFSVCCGRGEPIIIILSRNLKMASSSVQASYDADFAPLSMSGSGIELSAMVGGSELNALSVDEGTSQTYYVKLKSQPKEEVILEITGHEGTTVTLDNDRDANTPFTGLFFTSTNWNLAQGVVVTAAVDGEEDDKSVALTHEATSDDIAYDGHRQTIVVTVTDVSRTSKDAEGLPTEITLEQNYPNPFNPSTVIEFSLPASEVVTLRVFDIMGRTLATLLDQKLHPAGTHTVQFNAARLASGVYLFRLETESSAPLTRTMLLVK